MQEIQLNSLKDNFKIKKFLKFLNVQTMRILKVSFPFSSVSLTNDNCHVVFYHQSFIYWLEVHAISQDLPWKVKFMHFSSAFSQKHLSVYTNDSFFPPLLLSAFLLSLLPQNFQNKQFVGKGKHTIK